jgi:hypothetical protein
MYAEQLLHKWTVARVGSIGDGKEQDAVDKEAIEYFRNLRHLHDHNVGEIVEIMVEGK